MTARPFTRYLDGGHCIPGKYDNHTKTYLSSMKGQFSDNRRYDDSLAKGDFLVYEVYMFTVPEVSGELLSGISIVHCGRVGDEYFMTKGHFHGLLETAEVYYCLSGRGYMVMQNPEGETSVEVLQPGALLYVPPRWAHRSVNTGNTEDLVTLFVYPANAGHDYRTIEKNGFRKLVVCAGNAPLVVDNPKWNSQKRS